MHTQQRAQKPGVPSPNDGGDVILSRSQSSLQRLSFIAFLAGGHRIETDTCHDTLAQRESAVETQGR